MTLGEKIISLRKTHKLSQEGLAEKLNVSRQTVSKWETDTSIPELERLVMLSELFSVSLDELVKSDTVSNENSPVSQIETYFINQNDARKIIGIMVLCVGMLGTILGSIIPFSLLQISGICFTLNGIVVLVFRKYTKLISGWLTTILLYSIIAFLVGDLFILFEFWVYPIFNVISIMCYGFWLLTILMTVFTIRTLKLSVYK